MANYQWTTGDEESLYHIKKLAEGGGREVHQVVFFLYFSSLFSLADEVMALYLGLSTPLIERYLLGKSSHQVT